MDVFDLFAKISLDSSEYEKGLNAAKSMATSAMSIAGGAFVAMGAAATAATGALVSGVSELAQYGDGVDKMSQKLGMSAEAYQEWDAIMQHCGTTIDSMQGGMSALSKAAENGSDAFDRLGITQEQIANMSQEELFAATIDGLQQLESGTERNVLAQELLGRSSRELGALLNMTSEETADMRDRVHELGGVMSDETVKAAAQFQDNLQDMQTAIDGLKRGITSDLLPSFNLLMEGFTSMLIGEEGGTEAFSEGFTSMLDTISDVSDRAMDLIGQIAPVIFDTLLQNLPDFISFGGEIIGKLVSGLMENADAIIGAAESILQLLLNGIIDAENSQGASGIVRVLENIVNMLIRNAPLMLRAAQSIIRQLGSGLSNAVRTLTPVLVSIVSELAKSLTDPATISTIIQSVMDIAMSIGQALFDALPTIISLIPELLQNLLVAFTDNFPVVLSGIISLVEMITSQLPDIIIMLTDNLPAIIQMVADTIVQCSPLFIEAAIMLVSILVQNLPAIISALVQAMPVILNSLLQAFKTIGDALLAEVISLGSQIGAKVVEWFSQIKQDITAKWNELIENIKEWFAQIPYNLGYFLADAFLKVLDFADDFYNWVTIDLKNIIDDLVEWFKGLPDRIKEFFDLVIENISMWATDTLDLIMTEIPKIIDGISEFFEELPDKAFEWGMDMIQNFIDGIGEMASHAWDAVDDFCQGIADRIGFSEPKIGVLSNFHTYAPDMIDLFVKGIRDNENKIYDQIEDSFNFRDQITDASAGGTMTFVGNASAGLSTNANQPITVVLELDKVKLAETIFTLNKDESQRMGVQLANV